MRLLKRILKSCIKSIALLTLLLIPCVYFLVSTNPGLQVSVYFAKKILGKHFSIKQAKGNLINHIHISDLSYQSKTIDISMKNFELSWSIFKTLIDGIEINNLKLRHAKINIKYAPEITSDKKKLSTTSVPNTLNSIKALRFKLNNIDIEDLVIQKESETVNLEKAELSIETNNNGFFIKNLITKFHSQIITGKGEILFKKDYPVNLLFKSSGNIQSNLEIKGDHKKYELITRTTTPLPINGKIIIKPNRNIYDITGNFKSGLSKLRIMGKLNWQKTIHWHGGLSLTKFNPKLINKNLNGLIQATISTNGEWNNKIITASTQTVINGSLLNKPLKANFVLGHEFFENTITINWGGNRFIAAGNQSLAFNLSIPHVEQLSKTTAQVHTSINAKGTIGLANKTNIVISPGKIVLPSHQTIPFQGGNLALMPFQHGFKIGGKLTIDKHKWTVVDIRLPNLLSKHLKQTIQAQLGLFIDNIAFVDAFIPDIQNTRGKLQGNLLLNGSLYRPAISTNIKLLNASTYIRPLGISAHDININLKGSLQHYQISGKLASGDGHLTFNGDGNLKNQQLSLDLNIKGKNALLLNTDEYKIFISPELTLQSKNHQLLLTGKVHIPKAKISPHDFSSTVELPEDVVITNHRIKSSNTLEFGYQTKVSLGDDVNLSVAGVSGKLQGSLQIDSPINQLTTAIGVIKLIDGKYHAYGQRLQVKKGRFTYTGGPLNNPGIYVEAIRQFNYQSQYAPNPNQSYDSSQLSIDDLSDKITVGVFVTGNLKSPKVKLFSNPSNQNQSDILSMLVLGRPASQASSEADSGLLMSAISSLNLGGGSSGQQLTDQLQHSLGLDMLGIETQSNYNADTDTVSDSTALVIGKSLSSKLALNYSIGLGQGNNILRIKYQFTPSWSIQTESDGSASGIDIIYNYVR